MIDLPFYMSAMSVAMVEQLRIDNSLRYALERNEFILHYQPQIDLKTGEIVGMETLLRWQHPSMGMISPAVFIPIARKVG
jgi:sensor c-di-GMP phosphodiesterase-like protein